MTITRALPLLIGAATFAFRLLALDRIENDHFVYIARGVNVLHGDWPVRDFEDPGSPLVTLASAGASALFGGPLAGEVVLGSAMLGAAAAVTVAAASAATGSLALGVWAAAIEVAVMPRLYAYPKVLIYSIAAWLFVRYGRAPTTSRIAWLGALTGVAFLLRHDHALYLSIGVAILLVAVHRTSLTRMGTAAARYVTVSLLVMAPFLAYVQATRGLGAYFAAGLRFSVAEAHRAGGWTGTVPFLAWILVAMPVLALAVAAIARRAVARDTPAIAALAMMLAVTEAAFLRDQIAVRMADVAAPAAVLAAWLIAQARNATRGRPFALAAAAAGAVVFSLAAVRAGDAIDEAFDTRLFEGPRAMVDHARLRLVSLRRWPWTTYAPAPELAPLVAYINRCTADGDRVLVGWFAPELPVLARRPFAGGHAALVPGYYTTDADQALMIARIGAGGTALALLHEREREGFEKSWPALTRFLAMRYQRVGRVDAGGGIEVLAARDRPERGRDPQLDLPCFR